MVAQNILADHSADGVNAPGRQPLVGAAHIDREYTVGTDWQPFDSQRNIAEHENVASMLGLPRVAHGNSFGSAVAQFDERLGGSGVEHDVDGPATDVAHQLQVSNFGARHRESPEAVLRKQFR